ncbi:MAG TPA: hypothetical protein VF597_03370 [Candidatus Saccharimonadales bacterium]|jgi:hypothetical protein
MDNKAPELKTHQGRSLRLMVRDVLAKARDPKNRRVMIIGAIIVACLLALIGWLLYRQLTAPTVTNPILSGIRKEDENYDRMTPAQVDAQLERQIGHGTTYLSEHDVTKGLLKNHKNAWRAAKALRRVQQYDKSLDAYKVGAQLADKKIGYEFFYDYGMNAAGNEDYSLASEQLEEAKRRLNESASSKQSKQDTLKTIDWQIALNKAQADQN